ncbi:MAG: aldehyde dehydrogenase family protein [Solirubrobacterales bacterium]
MALLNRSRNKTSNGSATGVPAETHRDSFEVINPATGEPIATVPVDGPDTVHAVAERLRASQPEWEALGIKGRSRWLNQLRDWLFDNQEQVAETMQRETGKVRAEAGSEAVYLTDLINFYGKKAPKMIGDQKVRAHSPLMASKKLRIQYRPFQLVGVISPWNFPLILSLGDGIPALQAGAAVLIKPSEVTPLGITEIIEAWKSEIGGPDVIDVVHGMGETGSALVDEADFIQFTGSDVTGKKVMAQAAETLTPVSLELGGNDAMIVLEGSDVDRAAAAAAWGGFANCGQVCMSVERTFVAEPVYEEFVTKFAAEVNSLNMGIDGPEYGMEQGAITFPKQMKVAAQHVADAKQKGARVVAGGAAVDRPGDWFEPTVLADTDTSMEVMKEETFGPVVGVMKVKDAEQAVRLANQSRHGLTGYVFGRKREAEQAARRLEVGAAVVNDVLVNFLASDVPMGGWKDSGVGYRHGEYGIKKFVRPESLVLTRFGGKRELLYFPYTQKRREQLAKVARFFNARDLKRRLGRK